MKPGAASITRFYFSVVIVPQPAAVDQKTIQSRWNFVCRKSTSISNKPQLVAKKKRSPRVPVFIFKQAAGAMSAVGARTYHRLEQSGQPLPALAYEKFRKICLKRGHGRSDGSTSRCFPFCCSTVFSEMLPKRDSRE
jgi:hypothetical protein